MKVRILREAEIELNEAVDYYEGVSHGLGFRLREEVRATILWISDNPAVPRLRSKGNRRVSLKVFPFYLAYLVWSDVVWILAMAHAHRQPDYWLSRRVDVD